jgi:hypothetical protein
VLQRGLVAQDHDRAPGAAERHGVGVGGEHLERDDVAVVPGHAVEIAHEQGDRTHRRVGGKPVDRTHECFIHMNE